MNGKGYVIRKDIDGYGTLKDLPDELFCIGTFDQAINLARYMSSFYPGLSYSFYVVRDNDESYEQ